MNVVVPNVACPPAAAKKIRRKPENKVSRVNPETKTRMREERKKDEESLVKDLSINLRSSSFHLYTTLLASELASNYT